MTVHSHASNINLESVNNSFRLDHINENLKIKSRLFKYSSMHVKDEKSF